MHKISYLISSSPFGAFAVVWRLLDGQPRITRLILPGRDRSLEDALRAGYPQAAEGSHPVMEEIAAGLRRFLEGEDVRFDLRRLAWENCGEFQARVLRAESGIPRGWVSTYGRIARHLGLPGGARAVGSALANNPFPLLIPCHRAVRSTGELGGFQGGLEMKRALLEREGVDFRSPTKVALDRVYY